MKLTTYFRSTAAYRVRIALNIKGLKHELIPVNLLKGEQKSAEYKAINPEALLPTLETGPHVLAQSVAILEYLEEIQPQPSLLPKDSIERALVRGMAQAIACDIHPLNNLRVLKYLVSDLGVSEDDKLKWYHHWLDEGFRSIEQRLKAGETTGLCCFGDQPTMADLCLIPQVYNAKRFELPLDDYPIIRRIEEHCLSLTEFAEARPEAQADAN